MSTKIFGEFYRLNASLMLALLLGLYLVFNKPFALLGWPPLYIGEMVLLATVPALLMNFRHDVLRALKQSWGLNLVAAFFIYGCGHVVYDYQTYGLVAFRDGVLVGYALLAFLAPALWRPALRYDNEYIRVFVNSDGSGYTQLIGLGLSGRVWLGLLIFSFGTLCWAKATVDGDVDLTGPLWNENKADFTTLATGVAVWIFSISTLRLCPICTFCSRLGVSHKIVRFVGWILLGLATFYAVKLLLRLPTRAVWTAAFPIAAVCLMVLPSKPSLQKSLAWLVVLATLGGGLFMGLKFWPTLDEMNTKYELKQNMNWSVAELEADLKIHPETYPVYATDLDLSNLDPVARRERFGSIFDSDETKFSTQAGQRGAHSNKWRLVFWQRVFNFTAHQAPYTGLGFGPNLTNLNRQTPAWPMYIPAMSVGLRSPHSAHLSIFARMGLIGLVLWLGLLFCTATEAVAALWRHRTSGSQTELSTEFKAHHRSHFFSLLAVLGAWLIYLCTMTFSVTLENPMGGMPFWALTGVLLLSSRRKYTPHE